MYQIEIGLFEGSVVFLQLLTAASSLLATSPPTYLPTYLPKYNTNKLLRVLIRHSMNPIFDESQTVS